MKEVYYHGSSSIIKVGDKILPAIETGNIREDWRKKQRDVVFYTNSLIQAQRYAWKDSLRTGDDPIVYIVEPDYETHHKIHNGEFIADSCVVVGIKDIQKKDSLI